MQKDYDGRVREAYIKAAQEQGLSPLSTMPDSFCRELETDFIRRFAQASRQHFPPRSRNVLDVGCGNGYTLHILHEAFCEFTLQGIEINDNLRELALKRFEKEPFVQIFKGDLRDEGLGTPTLPKANLLICQRVLINILDVQDQRKALRNILEVVVPGGRLLFIEAFANGLVLLNEARAEFGLSPIATKEHNLFLPDDFFNVSGLVPIKEEEFPINFASTNYFVTRVLHPAIEKSEHFKRNSHFVRFFNLALRQDVGDFSPLRAHVFRRV